MITRWRNILAGRCPRCRRGPLFQTLMKVHRHCPECRLLLEREEGYFLGAMYLEYMFGALCIGAAFAAVSAVSLLSFYPAVACAVLLFLPCIPFIIRLSRTLWIYWDNAIDPQ